MVVYTLFSPKHAHMLRLWSLSWERRGWTTRLLTPRDVEKHGSVARAMKGRAGIFVPPTVINFSMAAPKRGQLPVIRGYPVKAGKIAPKVTGFGKRHWDTMPLVSFKREFEVLNCGRPL